MGYWHCTRAYTAIGDPARRLGIPQLWYWHGTVQQGSVRFNLREEESPPTLFLSCCTFSMGEMDSAQYDTLKNSNDCEILTKIENVLTHWSVAQIGSNDEKREG